MRSASALVCNPAMARSFNMSSSDLDCDLSAGALCPDRFCRLSISFLTDLSASAFLIRNSIWNKGIATTNFFERPFELAFAKLPDELVESYGLDVEELLKYSLK